MNKYLILFALIIINISATSPVNSEELPKDSDIKLNKPGIIENTDKQLLNKIENLNKEIESNPDNINLYLERGKLYFSNKEYDLSIKDFDIFIKKEPDNIQGYLNQAKSFLSKKMFEESITDYNMANQIDPLNKDAYEGLRTATREYGLELIRQGKKNEGKAKLIESAQLSLKNKIIENDDFTVSILLSVKYVGEHKPEMIIALLKNADKSHPLINEANMLLANAYIDIAGKQYDSNKNQDSINSLLIAKKIAFSITPQNVTHKEDDLSLSSENIKQFQIASSERVKELKDWVTEAIKLGYSSFAETKIYHKDYKGAIIELEKLNKLYPNHEYYYLDIGYALFLDKQKIKGINMMNKAIKLFPQKGEIFFQFACIQSLSKNKTLALNYLKRSIELNKNLKVNARKAEDFNFIKNDKAFKSIVK
jgi:tetratricopeptide (TPR) repeat protein